MDYKSLILRDEKAKSEESAQFIVEEASQQMAADILATKKQIATIKHKLANSKSAIPFSPKAVLETMIELEGYEKGLEYLTKINQELFGNVETSSDKNSK